jgi:hypothetical protein
MLAASSSGQPTVIKVAPGHYSFTQTFDSTYGPSALPPVNTAIFVVGEDSATTTFDDSTLAARFFTVVKRGHLRVHNVTITGGIAFCNVDDCAQDGGGVAENAGGVLEFEDCVLSGNGTSEEEGRAHALGGAILNLEGRLEVVRTTITGNGAAGNGGGVALVGGIAMIRDSIISNNSTFVIEGGEGTLSGGGIYVTGGMLSVVDTSIGGNTAGYFDCCGWEGFGAGIFNSGGKVRLSSSAVTENVALREGAGGGILNSGEMILENTTVGGNSAGTLGGGIMNSGTLTLQGVTVVRNEVRGSFMIPLNGPAYPPGCDIAEGGYNEFCFSGGGGIWNDPSATIRVATSVVATNSGFDCHGVLISEGHNAIGDDSGCTLQASRTLHHRPTDDQVNLDPRIGDLQDDGDAGNAHYPLLADSPLIDAGGRMGRDCTPRDQIGQHRVEGDQYRDAGRICDVGAIEFQPDRKHRKH